MIEVAPLSAHQNLQSLGSLPVLEIEGFDKMEPFLMTVVSDSNLWMYVSSLGSLTAGRTSAEHSLFPYAIEDHIHRLARKIGPFTVIRIILGGGEFEIWEPFAGATAPVGFRRNLYKSAIGSFLIFEEVHERLGLTFRYRWASCEQHGFVRTSEIVNQSGTDVELDIVDGLLNIVASGIPNEILQHMSILSDAYTECEVDAETGIAILSLASLIVDKPEPGESLFATVVWSRGLDDSVILLTEDQVPDFCLGSTPTAERFLRGRRGNFLLSSSIGLRAGESRSWDIVADIERSQAQVEELRASLIRQKDMRSLLKGCLEQSVDNLAKYVAMADGQTLSGDEAADRHLQSCVLFNVMRGGIFAEADSIRSSDYRHFLKVRNPAVYRHHENWVNHLAPTLPYQELLAQVEELADPNLLRLTYEYLPISFSRRHGDPSRPWNKFSIRLKNQDGSPLLAYEGNWRDIFQNWEALSLSFPMFLEGIIAKFVNASTVDGFNPYRIMREGIDWETPDPNDSWSTIGYWGDHQIIYLLKFLELVEQVRPDGLNALLGKACFCYANVPLRIRDYDAIVQNPHSTIDFDFDLDKEIKAKVATLGTDAKLLSDSDGNVFHVTLAEKLLVPALAKLSNLVVDGGIWMNTQRPEWNDANNALVGNGVSMVTLCYLRRYLRFVRSLFERNSGSLMVTEEVVSWLTSLANAFAGNQSMLEQEVVLEDARRELLDQLGRAFSDFRATVYKDGFSGFQELDYRSVVNLIDLSIPFLDHSIRSAKRQDGLYHAYNLLDVREPGVAKVGHLYEMLEGQVAVLSAGLLEPLEIQSLLAALFESKIYRPDQQTFMLYPNRKLRGFLEKNLVDEGQIRANLLLAKLIDGGDRRIVIEDTCGHFRFAPNLRNAADLRAALEALAAEESWSELVKTHGERTLETYEDVFGHRFFTGRSGAMYGYEGLGSVYWHMVSKLMVAVGECYFTAQANGATPGELLGISRYYYQIRNGMGFKKTAKEFGAFPADPYSHTPWARGAKQPGLTGQTKEDILARWMELGVRSDRGRLQFKPTLLRRDQFLKQPKSWHVKDINGHDQVIALPERSLGFTVCGVPVVYHLEPDFVQSKIQTSDGNVLTTGGTALSKSLSQAVFSRNGHVTQIDVHLTTDEILRD
jgi:hypothetical protein